MAPSEIAALHMTDLNTILRMYREVAGVYPSTGQGFEALIRRPAGSPVPVRWTKLYDVGAIPTDPWGNSYVYRSLAPDQFSLFSLGPDGVESADDIRAP
jgi:general secretion pathway protein G